MTYLLFDITLSDAYTLMILKKYYSVHQFLFKGTKDEVLEDVSPWLFQIDDLFRENLHNEPGVSIGSYLLLESGQDIYSLCAHLKQFIYQTISGREYFFRFWDGRVLEKFLPTCHKEQIITFFRSIERIKIKDCTKDEIVESWQEYGKLNAVISTC